EEGLVSTVVDLRKVNRTPDPVSKLVLFLGSGRGCEKPPCVKLVVAEKFPGSTVQVIRAASDMKVQQTGAPPELGRIGVSVDGILVHRLKRRCEPLLSSTTVGIHVRNAVIIEILALVWTPVNTSGKGISSNSR